MIITHTIAIYSRTASKTLQGGIVNSYSFLKTIGANFQPKTLTEHQSRMYGINAQTPNAKWIGYETDPQIVDLMRALVDGVWYEIRALNHWPSHDEAILVPVGGI